MWKSFAWAIFRNDWVIPQAFSWNQLRHSTHVKTDMPPSFVKCSWTASSKQAYQNKVLLSVNRNDKIWLQYHENIFVILIHNDMGKSLLLLRRTAILLWRTLALKNSVCFQPFSSPPPPPNFTTTFLWNGPFISKALRYINLNQYFPSLERKQTQSIVFSVLKIVVFCLRIAKQLPTTTTPQLVQTSISRF